MIDKIVINVPLSANTDIEALAERNKLQKCSSGNTVFWQSQDEAKIIGLYMRIKERKMQIKCSLHKQFYFRTLGSLDNSGQFTLSNAKWMIKTLFEEIGIEPKSGFITYYEIGLNIPTDRPPIEYIESAKSIGGNRIRGKSEKETFIDANFKKNRQKTTDKSRTIRKFFKMYDKGFEMSDRKRQPHDNDPNILRLETVFRRQKINIEDFFNDKNLNKIAIKFNQDWRSVEFEKSLKAEKGTRTTEKERASLIFKLGIDGYKSIIHQQLKSGKITPKMYRVNREFARDWSEHKKDYSLIQSELEKEYREKFGKLFKTMKDIPIWA